MDPSSTLCHSSRKAFWNASPTGTQNGFPLTDPSRHKEHSVNCLEPKWQRIHARVILDGAARQLGDPGEVDDALGVLGVDRGVPIAVRVLVSWQKEE